MKALASIIAQWRLAYLSLGVPKRVVNLVILAFVLLVLLGATSLMYMGENMASLLPEGWGNTLRQSDLSQPSPFKKVIADSVLLDQSHSISYVLSTSYQMKTLDISHALRKLLSTERLPATYSPLLEDTRHNIDNEEWIKAHWFHALNSRVWFEQENMYFVVHQLTYKPGSGDLVDRKLQEPALSVLYALFESDDMVPKSDFLWRGHQYPTIIPIDIKQMNKDGENDKKAAKPKTVGPLEPKIIPFTTDEGAIRPLLVFTLETSEGPRIHWMTTGETRQWTLPKPFKLNNVEKPKYKSWAPFGDSKGALEALIDDAVHFVYTAGTNAIIKCQLWNSECAFIDKDAAKDAKEVSEFSNGSPLYSIYSHLEQKLDQFEDIWIGFVDITMNNCGCGQRMDRPGLVVYVKEKDKGIKLAQLSQALDFSVPISGWDHLDKEKEACFKVSSMRISSAIVEKGSLRAQVTTSGAISFDLIINDLITEINKGLSFEEKYTPPSISLALERSKAYCQTYAKKHTSILSYFYDDDNETTFTETEDGGLNDNDIEDNSDDVSNEVFTAGTLKGGKKLVLYPAYINNPMDHYLKYFGVFDNTKEEMMQLSKSIVKHPNSFTDFRYKDHQISVYSAFVDLHKNPTREVCKTIRTDIPLQVSDGIDMTFPASKFISKYIHNDPSLSAEQLAYFHEFDELMKDKIEDMKASNDVIDQHWFRFAGASVYLEEYGIYFVTTRIIYSKTKQREKPVFSMTHIEIYDRNWEELNVDMVVPATDDDTVGFRKFNYPGFVRVASYNNANVNSIKNYGPEDPRILLRKNHLGHEEPVIVFNQKQRDVVKNDGEKVNLKEHRSFFMCLPWEIQEGKSEVDPLSFKETRTTYTKTIELTIFDDLTQEFVSKKKTEKNWTPFFSMEEREKNNGVDKSIYFVYLWEYIQVLKCEIPTAQALGSTVCKSVFWNKPTDNHHAYLRGGTQLVSLSSILKDLPEGYEKVQHEVWLGFGRSHMGSCGCGVAMYRPQLTVLAKDFTEHKYQLTHVSSFASFDLEVVPWGEKLCQGGPNVFLPNGIAKWHSQVVNDRLDDVMTLLYSMSDRTIGRIKIRGLVNELYKIGAFKLTGEADALDNSGTTDFFKVTSQVQCASHQSWDFCADYGKLHKEG